jgi:hypothetical protein
VWKKKGLIALPAAITSLLSIIDAISSLTVMEWVQLKSTLISVHNPRFDCHKCAEKYPGRPELLKKERTILGCFGIREQPIHKIEGINYYTCIGNFCDESAISWVEAHSQFELGVMPFEGGYMDQPAKAIETMRVIGNYKTNWQVERAKKQELQRKAKLSHGR